jgi:methionyl-tRNA formyltransferase
VAEDKAITVACADGGLEIVELQPAGGRRMPAPMFAARRQLDGGGRFGAT